MVDPLPASPVRLEAPGLALRAYAQTDAPDLLAAFADEDIARWNPAGSTDAEGVAAFMRSRNDWTAGDHASWAVADPTGRLVGSVSVHRLDLDQGDAEVGYWVAPWARRQGYAVRAVLLATRFGFGRLGLHRMYLYHAVDNPGSCAVALAAGYRHEGTLRQSYRYADGVHHDEHLHARLADDPEPPGVGP